MLLFMKPIILCADDYGLNAAVSQGIVNLLQRQRLSAVSCMTNAPLWPEHAPWLKPFQAKVDLGLHFNLTEGKALSSLYKKTHGEEFYPHSRLILQAFLRKLEPQALEQECEAQLNKFVSEMGFFPKFIDGHQHIHQLPQIRDAILKVYQKHLASKGAYLRSVLNSVKPQDFRGLLKQIIIYLCGAPGFQHLLRQFSIPHNAIFAGIYSFSEAGGYAEIFPYFLKNMKEQGLIMCHPGLAENTDKNDPIAAARYQEYSYLVSEKFEVDCKNAGVQLSQFVWYNPA